MKVAVVGAGPAGALIACGLAERGCDVTLFERRSDPLRVPDAQRTIQLSLSPRGLKALEAVGLREAVMARGIPLAARAFHPRDGASRLLPYPDPTWRNASIDRHTLAATVLDRALAQPRLTTRFGVTVADVEVRSAGVITQASDGTLSHEQFDLVIGADGVASQVRAALVRSPEVDFAKRVSPWGYAELSFTLPEGDAYRVPAIHVFPRETFFIACFPGRDGKLHGTLVAQHSAWQAARDAGSLAALLRRELPDLIPCLTRPIEQVAVRSLLPITIVRCGSWTDGERLLLAGDAAHATAPFMGQGVNIGLEDGAALLRVWDEQSGDRQRVCEAYQRERVAEGLACCDLSERAADLLLRMPPENPPPTPHPLTRLNFMGHRYADVARDIIPGWQPEIYAQAAAPALGDGLQFPAALLEPFDASPGALLFRQGDNADELLVLQSGSVQVASPTLGALSLRGPTVIGEMGWLGSPHRTASVTCETPCSLARLSYAKLDAFCSTQPALALPLLRQLATLAMERLNGRFHRAPSYLILQAGAEAQQLERLATDFRELLAGTALIGGEREAEILERSGLRLTRLLPEEHLVEALLLAIDAGELAGAVLFGSLATSRQLTHRLDAKGVAWTTNEDEARALLKRRAEGTLPSGLHAVLTPA